MEHRLPICSICHKNKLNHLPGQETSPEQSLLGSDDDMEQARPQIMQVGVLSDAAEGRLELPP